jgi:hypothetical protein
MDEERVAGVKPCGAGKRHHNNQLYVTFLKPCFSGLFTHVTHGALTAGGYGRFEPGENEGPGSSGSRQK